MIRVWYFLVFLVVPSLSAAAQDQTNAARQVDTVGTQIEAATLYLTGERWEESSEAHTWAYLWKFHPGDDPEWASPEYDDRDWELVATTLRKESLPKNGWTGVGWFRLHVVVDSMFPHQSLGMTGSYWGAVQIYWDGVLQTNELQYRVPDAIAIGGPGRHLLAVRFEHHDVERVHAEGYAGGFSLHLGEFRDAIATMIDQKGEQMFFTALMIAFGFIHLMLFAFSPSSKGNMYYAAFLFLMAITTYIDIQQQYLTDTGLASLHYLIAHRAAVPFTSIFFLRFVYSIFYPKCPRHFWVFVGVMLIVAIIIVQYPQSMFYLYVYGSTIITIEIIRVLVIAIRRKKPGAWIVGIGFILVGIFSGYDTLLDLEVMTPINQVTNAYYFGFAGLLGAMSIYLARDFARTSQRLIDEVKRAHKEEMSRRLLEVDNERKTRELEDARQLQLSMLPPCQNDIPGIDICFSMNTASEVGGDYYDYLRTNDTLTIAIGDATGHGMKAGTMVSIIKSLFITHAPHPDFPAFMRTCSEAIRQMALGNLYMGLTMVRIDKGQLDMTSAGMPPAYIYRSATGTVDEIVIKSMPLGGPAPDTYQTKTASLAKGDVLLLLSDGLPELFNPEGELFDYPRVKEFFSESVNQTATGIARTLMQKGKEWANGKAQGDDITLVVVKVTA